MFLLILIIYSLYSIVHQSIIADLSKAQAELQALRGMLLKPVELGFGPWATSYIAHHLEETRILVVGLTMDLQLAKTTLEAMVADLNSQ